MDFLPGPNQHTNLDWLAQRALVSPTHTALIHREQSWSYADLNRLADRLAGQLYAAGLRAGEHVAALLPNSPEFVVLIHALIRMGCVLVPLNLRLTGEELGWQLEQSDSGWLIHNRATRPQAEGVAGGSARRLALEDLPEPVDAPGKPLDPGDAMAILYTSGTTGHPKGVVQTLGNHFWGAMASAFRVGTLPTDRWLLSIPLYHVGGLAIPLRCCLYGSSVVIPAQAGRFEALSALAEMERQRVSLVSLVPTMLQRLLDCDRPFPACLRLILLGGAAASPELLQRALERGLPVACTYGLTETASQAATTLPEETVRKPGSVGKPLLFTQIFVRDERDRDLPRGEIGEIVVSGPGLMREYYRRAQATAETLRAGVLHTGDLGYLDADGDLWVLQRRADLIVSGGENIYPAEVERILLEHPAVREACVVGVQDAEWGQKVAAAVVLKSSADVDAQELQEFCRQRLAGFKLPRLIRFLAALPQTASGKVRYEAVRQLWT